MIGIRRLPLRLRLVTGFVVTMLVVLTAAGAFVYWRVRYALDLRLDDDLTQQSQDLQRAAEQHPDDPVAALRGLPAEGRFDQLLLANGHIVAAGHDVATVQLLPSELLARAGLQPLRYDRGNLLLPRGRHLRLRTAPVPGAGRVKIALVAVRADARDEALRELLAQLAIANVLALGVASLVGYRLARAALAPVERYRTQVDEIAAGARGIRLDVPASVEDEITRLGRTLNRMLEAQDDAAAQQQQFVADASHELRTPLTLLTSEVELALRRTRSREELEETLQAVATDTARLVALADSLLDLTAAGESPPWRSDIELEPVLEAAARNFRAVPPEPGREIAVSVPADLLVRGDPLEIERAVTNLLDNAIRHGAGRVELAASADPEHVSVAVHDQGTMPPDFLRHAADRFRRADDARTTPGSGLGLALVDAIVRRHDGQLRLCSAGAHHHQPTDNPRLRNVPCAHPAEGTTVSALLPTDAGA